MSALLAEIKGGVDELIVETKTAAADGLTLSEIVRLAGSGYRRIVKMVESAGGTGAEKREAAIVAIERYYDEAVAPIDIKGVNNFIEPVVDAAIGRVIRPLTGSLIDFIVDFYNETKVFKKAA